MNINYIKYLNLFKKDLLVTKNTIFFVIYFFILTICSIFVLKNNIVNNIVDNLLNTMATIVILEMIALGSQQVLIPERCKGDEILLTTTYTRKDIVLSRYLFFYTLAFIIIILNFLVSIFIFPSLFNFYALLEYLFIICIGTSILVLLSFKINNNLVYTFISTIFMAPILTMINSLEKFDFIEPYILSGALFLLSLLAVFISFKLSKKIYLNKSF